MYTYNLQTN